MTLPRREFLKTLAIASAGDLEIADQAEQDGLLLHRRRRWDRKRRPGEIVHRVAMIFAEEAAHREQFVFVARQRPGQSGADGDHRCARRDDRRGLWCRNARHACGGENG